MASLRSAKSWAHVTVFLSIKSHTESPWGCTLFSWKVGEIYCHRHLCYRHLSVKFCSSRAAASQTTKWRAHASVRTHVSMHTQTHSQIHVCLEISAQNNHDFLLFSSDFRLKLTCNIIQFLSTPLCAYLLAIYVCSIHFSMLYFSLRDQTIPGRQKIAGKTSWQTPLQQHGPVTRRAHVSQGSAEMVGCLKARAGASDRHNPRRSGARGIHPLEHSLILAEAGSTGRLSFYCLTLEEKGAEKQLCPRFAHLYRENTWMEAVCPPHQTPYSV